MIPVYYWMNIFPVNERINERMDQINALPKCLLYTDADEF